VQRLMRIAEPDNRVFKKKTTILRVAAVQALGEARPPAALAALKELLADKDREVRERATRVLAHAVPDRPDVRYVITRKVDLAAAAAYLAARSTTKTNLWAA